MKRLTRELNELNLSMDRLLANSQTLHQQAVEFKIIPDIRGASSLAVLLHQIRDSADRLFQAFHSAWTGGCHPSHEAMLHLDIPVSPRIKRVSSRISSFKFRLVLCEVSCDTCEEPVWHETNVTVFEEDESKKAVVST